MTEQSRLIKKYPNRRLYDTKTSAYITLGDVKQMVLDGETFNVVDAKTGDDLTRSILLQIILEEESGGGLPLFSTDLLSQMIRFYGHAMQGMVGQYLETNIRAFTDFQAKLQEQSRGVYGDSPPLQKDMWSQFLNFQGPAMQTMMAAYVEKSRTMFQQMQDQLQQQTRTMFTGIQFPGFPPEAGGKTDTDPR